MSGVQVGTRLDQLVVLRDQIDLEIARERRKAWANGGGPTPTPTTGEALLRVLGVTSYDVKAWAVREGLLPRIPKARVSLQLIRAYQEANHQT